MVQASAPHPDTEEFAEMLREQGFALSVAEIEATLGAVQNLRKQANRLGHITSEDSDDANA